MSARPVISAFAAPALCIAMLAGACGGSSAETFELADGVVVSVRANGSFSLEVAGQDSVEVAPGGPVLRRFDETVSGAFAIFEFDRQDEVEIELSEFQGAELMGDRLVLRYESADGGDGANLEISRDGAATRLILSSTNTVNSLALPVSCDARSTFLGFGEQYNATDQRGERFELVVSEQGIGRTGQLRGLDGDEHTTYFPMPYYLDARGFGVLFETPRRVLVDLCSTDADKAWFEVVDGRPLSALVLDGPTPKDVVAQLSSRVGRPAMPPAWAYDVWIGSQGGPAQVMADAQAAQAAGIPVSAMWVQDWTGTRINADGGSGVQYRWQPDEVLYPDLAGLITTLRGMGLRFLAYANPFVDPSLPNHYDTMDAGGLLIGDPDGGSYRHVAPNGQASHPDLSSQAARDYVKGELTAMVETYGIDGWMADFGEWLPFDSLLSDGSDAADYHNLYPIEWQRLSREVLDQVRPDGDYVVFGRSGWTGAQGASQIYWVGDQETSFSETDGLPTVVPAMINLGLSAVPYVTHDIAGFSSAEGPSDKELYMRWTELGAFTPFMRTHEGALRTENWAWDSDAETTLHFARFARVHEALAAELQELAVTAASEGLPIVRHMLLEFPDDSETYRISDQYMLGAELLVAPILTQGATSRELYLPAGRWFHVWTGTEYEGGQMINIDAPIGSPPVFSLGADRSDLREIE